MANRAIALGRANLKYPKILHSPIKTSKRKETKTPPWGGLEGSREYKIFLALKR